MEKVWPLVNWQLVTATPIANASPQSASRTCLHSAFVGIAPRSNVLDLCDAMDGDTLAAQVREMLATMTDTELLDLLNNDPRLAPMPDGTYERDTHEA